MRRRIAKRRFKKFRPYLKQFILKASTTETFELDDTPVEDGRTLKEKFDFIGFTVIGQVPGTIDVNSKRLYLCQAKVTRAILSTLITNNNLGWGIAAFEGRAIIQNRVLSHLLPDVDDQGVETPITDCTGRLNTVAGHNWSY